jgi:hypothetical protein
VTVGEVADGAPPEPVEVSLLRVREAHADLVAGTLLLRGESLGTSPDTTPTVTLSDVPLTVLSATEVEVLAQLPVALEAGAYRVRVVRTAPGGTASVWTDAMDVTTVAGAGQGDITAVNTPAGGGLQGGVTSGDASLGLLSCGLGQVLKSDGSSWSCAEDADTGVDAVAGGGGVTGVIAGRTLTLGSTATPANAPAAIVARDGSGGFAAGSLDLAGNLDLPNTTSASAGVLRVGNWRFLHDYGTENTFVGAGAGNFSLTGAGNSALGYQALFANTTGLHNSAAGSAALTGNTTGSWNSAFGSSALRNNATGHFNSAFGEWALYANATGFGNSAFGKSALQENTAGSWNVAFGSSALAVVAGDDCCNVALGADALHSVASGGGNTAVGDLAGSALVSGSHNIYIGNAGTATESNAIRIGDSDQTATYVAGIYEQTSADGLAVYVAPDGKLGTTTSSRRYKEQIADMDAESDVLLKLRPVSFYYRGDLDAKRLRQYGLVAEEVAEVAPGLVAYDEGGAPRSVRYHLVNAMLLNEVQRQRAVIAGQESRIRGLEARLARLEAASVND